MAEIEALLKIFLRGEEDDAAASKPPRDRARSLLRADPTRAALRRLLAVLHAGISPRPDAADGLGLQSWTGPQIEAVVAVVTLVVPALLPASADHADPVVLAIVAKSIEFCICFLEKSDFHSDDLSLQDSAARFLELTLAEFVSNDHSSLNRDSLRSYASQLSVVPVDVDNTDVGSSAPCDHQGIDFLRNINLSERFQTTSPTAYGQPGFHLSWFTSSQDPQCSDGLISPAQYLAVVRLKCFPRLLDLCKRLLLLASFTDKLIEDVNVSLRLSFGQRILNLLRNLAKMVPHNACDPDLLCSVAGYVDSFPLLFKLKSDFLNNDSSTKGVKHGSILLQILEEFLQFVQVSFSDTIIFSNVQACLVASVMDALDSKVWRYDGSNSSLKPPIIYCPQIVLFVLKLLRDAKSWVHQMHDFKVNSICLSDHYESIDPLCCIGGEKVSLIHKRTSEEYLNLMFPPSVQWVDNLIHLAYFLHSEGVKHSASIENSRLCCMKPANVPDSECTSSHEDEAIFGNLFSETCRPLGSTDGVEQPTSAVTNILVGSDLLIQAATELLIFLKVYIFSSEWSHLLFEDACQKIGENHIDQLLVILNGHTCPSGERNPESSSLPHSRLAVPHINESCFELLCSLVSHHALSDSLTDHFVDQVLKIEDGIFIYNDHTLSLLAHALVLHDDLGSNSLIMRIYEGYISFILEKAERNCCESTDVYRSLPSSFHLEIMLMSFHLSNDADKVSIVNFVFSSLRRAVEIPQTEFGTKQLFCWALHVSRLILILRHVIVYPSTCPSWLLSQVRSRLRKISLSQSRGHLSSWSSTVVGGMLKTSVRANPAYNVFLSHLIDVVLHPSPSKIDVSAIQRIGLNLHDVISTFSSVLDLWNGKKAEAIEHLVLERYIYSICWDTISTCCNGPELLAPIQGYNSHNLDLLDTRSFYNFLLDLISRGTDISKDVGFSEFISNLLTQLQDGLAVQGWDFLRKSSWFSLIVSLLHAGLSRYYARNVVHEEQSFLLQHPSSDGFVFVGENIVLHMFEQNQDAWLVSVLSSILKILLQFLDRSFICMFEHDQFSGNDFSPFILLKHTQFDKSKQDVLVEKYGCNVSQLESVYGVLLKLDTVAMQSTESTGDTIARCLLHGFPSNLDLCDGTLLSCALNIRDIIYVLGEYLKVKNTRGEVLIEDHTTYQLLENLVRIRSDKIFQEIHEKCDAIFNDLLGQREYTGYLDVLVVKQLESILEYINSGNIVDIVIKEMVVDTLVDSIQCLLRDTSKAQTFQFYLCSDGVPEKFKEFFDQQSGNLLVLINALDQCHSEMVSLKVINLFIDLLSGGLYSSLKEKVHKKFLDMDLSCLSNWLEKRLLGSITEPSGAVTVNNSSKSLRESTMSFISCLVSQPCESLSRELRSRLIEAMLMSLDRAFIVCDIQTAKAYFSCIVQLLNGEPSMKQLLEKTVLLIDKMTDNENLLNGLKFLLGFLGSVIGDFGANRNSPDKISSNLDLVNNSAQGVVVSKSLDSRKNPENLVLPSNRESGAASIDCDATSADDDEDDGTSDGELGSVDKDEEEDSSTERALASKVCTFTSSGSNFMEQHWYFCYTCDLTVSKGCCSVCAKVCHRGHRVVYSRSSRFFCDCGAGGVRGSSCQCLKPRKFIGSNTPPDNSTSNLQSLLPLSTDGEQPAESDSDLDDDTCVDIDSCFKLSIPKKVQDELPSIFINLGLENRLLELCNKLLPDMINQRESNLTKDNKIILGDIKQLCYSTELFQLKRAYKSGSLDLKIKADYPNSRELKSLLACGSLTKSLLTVSARGRLAAGEGDKVAIFDVGQLIGQPTVAPITADKTNVKPLSKNIVRFEIVHLIFNPVVENYLAVAGFDDCQVLTVNPRGEVTDRLAVELALQGAYIRRVDWVPGSQVQLMIVTNMFVKIYDLSQDNISPMHYFTLSDDMVIDAILVPASMGKAFLLVLSESGRLYRLEMSMEGDVGAKVLTDVIRVHEKDIHPKGLSLCFSSTYRLLILSYQDGITLMGRLDANVTSLMEVSYIYEADQDGKLRPASMHHWKELLSGSGLFVCLSDLKSNSALSVSLGPHEVFAQNMRYGVGSSLPLVGIASYKPLSKDKLHCLVLQDDGSLQIYSHVPVGIDSAAITNGDHTRKLGSNILNNRAYAGASPEFPLDFFEKTMCITGDVKFSSDAMKNVDSEVIKQKLTSDDGFLESPSATGFKVTVSNSNNDIVMVGCRIHVGNTSATHIPTEVTIFQRVVKLDEGLRSWYDIPFTVAESLLADEEFVISIGQTFDGSAMPRIDSLEVYGRAKDEFGWKEKMDAFLDMEASASTLGRSSASTGAGKKYQNMQAAPIQEQVLSDAIKLLSRIYSSCRSYYATETEDVDLDLSKLKSRTLLEAIFQSDRGAILHSAACHVLQSVFPKKETYYRVKDTMRLMGVVRSFPIIVSRTGFGGSAAGWVIREFSSQMQAVTKIALHRRANMAAFLETHGSDVVDGLMQVLWGILDLEPPETQTVNSIVVPAVELIYTYAECLALHGTEPRSVAPAVTLLKRLLFAPYEAVQTSSSLAISSRLLQVPFPKQTMLSTDDISENSATHGSDTNATGVNTHGMIEEDSTVASVQYCCDGCSTVPILRRRWHCNVCPDFDLCEACYEVLDADRLPPPHSRDHPMSAIPIEIDSLGGEGNDIHFPMDELGDPTLMQVAADISMQNSSSSIHILETSESGDFPGPVTDQTVVSLSASQRTLNSMLLRHLIGELKGWMESTSGFRAIPIMQLFYRLSSAVGGPFMDSSKPENLDLERFVKWLLDEINLNRSFPAKTRCSFGEIAILVFMFFTLMLRNWHQPGGESSQSKSGGSADLQDKASVKVPLAAPAASSSSDEQEKTEFASQLIRACSILRQQAFLNYLMEILQQLTNIFKSSSGDNEGNISGGSNCGSLLAVRRELPAGNFSPFFSDSYAKSHRADIFVDYHKLLLENTFRLVYSLVRPEKHDKQAEKEKSYNTSTASKDMKLDGFQDVLCSYISNPHTTFVRRYARRLLLHLCGSKTQYYSIRDSWQFSNEIKNLNKLVNKSGGFQNPVPYERSVKLVKCLSSMADVAVARPRNWQKCCLKHMDLLPFLMNGIFYFGEESVVQTLKLLNLAFYTGKDMGHSANKMEGGDAGSNTTRGGLVSSDVKKKRRGEDGMDNSEKICDMEQTVDVFTKKDGSVLRNFIDNFLLEWNSSSVRQEAKGVLYGIWHHGRQSFKEILLSELLHKVKHLPTYGQNITEYTELMMCLLGKVSESSTKQYETEIISRCLSTDVISCICETLHSQNELLANHPNSHIYNTLSGLVEFDGYYLESEPCVSCSCPEVPYSRMKLESLKSETKFTDNRIIVKCTGSYTIQSVTMNVHDARRSKSVKVLNLYYNNRPVADLSELKNNWSLWKRAKSCHLVCNQTELKVEFPIPITACNFMIELDSFYENLQASSLESLQCPRCSRSVTDKHGICSNCHENAYQCRQCRNINYENLDSFLCNECGYSKYGRFEFNFMAKPSFLFDSMENDEDMKKGLAAIESESENAHRRYQQLLGFKKPLLKLVSSIGENEIDSQQKDNVQQMMVSLPGPSCKINRKIALLGVLYGEKCKAAFDSVSKSVQTLQGLRRVLLSYLQHKNSDNATGNLMPIVARSPNNCYGCATTFVTQCLELLQMLSKHASCKRQLVAAGILTELFENNIHQGPKTARLQARAVLCSLSEADADAVSELNNLIQKKVMYCLEHHRSMDIALATREELLLLSETCILVDEYWEARLRVAFQLLFSSIKLGAKHPAISEHIILPCLRIISQACTPPRSSAGDKEQEKAKSSLLHSKNDRSAKPSVMSNSSPAASKVPSESTDRQWEGVRKGQDIPLLSYSEWEKGASYIDFVRRQYKVTQAVKGVTQRVRHDPQKNDYLALKYALKWKRHTCRKTTKSDFTKFALGSWVSELILSACSQSIRFEVCNLVTLLCPQSSARQFQLLNLLMSLLPATLSVGECAAEYFELFFKMIDSEAARLYLTVKGCLATICRLITQEVCNVESQERSLSIDISRGFTLHKLIELLNKFLELPNIRVRFMQNELLSEVLEALLVIRGLVVQKTKLIGDCNRRLKELLDGLLLESTANKRQFIRACISGLQNHGMERKGRTSLFILEQLCNIICPSKPEPVYLLILNKAHTQEEFIRGSMTKNPYSSNEIGPLMRDVKNKICHQLDLLGLLEDDYSMELLVAGNIISLDLSISQVYEQVWKKYHSQNQSSLSSTNPASAGLSSSRECPPMTVTYRLQGLDGEATEPMIKELEEEREESQDPEVEFAIAGAVRECGGLEVLLSMIQRLCDDELKSNQEELSSTLNLLMYCCKIRENRRALLQLGALALLLETARRAFSVDAMEPAEGILLIVESLTMEANESDIGINQSVLTITNEESGFGEQAKKIVLMFLDRLFQPMGIKKSSKQQRNKEMVARILPYLTYGEPAAMETLIQHFYPYLQDWCEFDRLHQQHHGDPKDEELAQQVAKQRSALENFVRVSESLKTSSCGERLKDIILEKGITSIAVKHLRENFAIVGQTGFKTNAEWISGLKLPSVPLILSMLRGLSKGHLATQRCIDEEGILPVLHALEGVPGENEIGARAENLLDTLADKEKNGDGFLGEKIDKLRHATKDEMRRLALRKREELLQGLGMRQEYAVDGGERIVVAQPVIEGLEDVEEEEGVSCMVCREGYTLRPNDMLGVYSYSKRVNLGATSSSSGRGDCVYTTVSHFNIIHFQCHQEAKRADAALKNPKKEWEGATLRNNETLCNCIFPLRGPSVPLAHYARCVDQYWDNLNALGRADGSRLRLLTYDIVLMLARFATGASFSTDSKGGGRESNSRFLPFMIQMASYLLDQGSSNQPRRALAKSVTAYLSSGASSSDSPSRTLSSSSGARTSLSSDETVQFMMVNSLLAESYEDWLQHRPAFLQRGIYHAYMQQKHGRATLRLSSDSAAAVVVRSDESSSTDLTDNRKLFTIVQPMLIYTGLIEQLQRFFKPSKGTGSNIPKESANSISSSSSGLERWEMVMKERMVNMKEMVSFSRDLLSWLEDMTSAADLQEAFDVMGTLGDAISGGISSCEDFVRAAIRAGKC